MKPLDYSALRKRVLMFYFAAGLNALMGFYVITAGSAIATRGTVWLIACVFIAFAGLNYYMARTLVRRWEAQARQQKEGAPSDGAGSPGK